MSSCIDRAARLRISALIRFLGRPQPRPGAGKGRAGAQAAGLRKTASASAAPAHAVMEMLEYMRGRIAGSVPATVALDGEFGISGVAIGVPCRFGPQGLTEAGEAPISEAGRGALVKAAAAVRGRLAG